MQRMQATLHQSHLPQMPHPPIDQPAALTHFEIASTYQMNAPPSGTRTQHPGPPQQEDASRNLKLQRRPEASREGHVPWSHGTRFAIANPGCTGGSGKHSEALEQNALELAGLPARRLRRSR